MITRNIDEARKAYLSGDIQASKEAHVGLKDEEGRVLKSHKEKHKEGGEFLKSAVYGGLDGIITTYSIVMGAAGASFNIGTVLILGVSNMIGDGISMGLGDYLSSKSEIDFRRKEQKREEWEIENNPEGEKLEMIEVYKNRGFNHEDAKVLSDTIAKSKKAWVEIMMVEELGLVDGDDSPAKNGIVTFVAFLVFGLIPLLPFIVSHLSGLEGGIFVASTVLTGFTLFFMGVIKILFTMRTWWLSGGETLLIGAFVAAAAYLIGWGIESAVNQH